MSRQINIASNHRKSSPSEGIVMPKKNKVRIPKDDTGRNILLLKQNGINNKCQCDCDCQNCINNKKVHKKEDPMKSDDDKLKQEILTLKEELDEVIDYWTELEEKKSNLKPSNTIHKSNQIDNEEQLDLSEQSEQLDNFDKEMIDYIFS